MKFQISQREVTILILLIVTVLIGVVSRLIQIENPILEDYLGDALYAVMFYLILSFFFRNASPTIIGFTTFVIMIGFELFQLTNIPLNFVESGNIVLKLTGILLGTTFSWIDILSYIVGIIGIMIADYFIY